MTPLGLCGRAAAGGEQVGEGADVLDECRVGRAGGLQFVEFAVVVFGQVGGSAHDPPDEAPQRRGRALGLGAALLRWVPTATR